MNKLLVIVDMQNDFIDGALGTEEAKAIVPRICDKIKNWDGGIVFTIDTHHTNYLSTIEGSYLPIEHTIKYSDGWYINTSIWEEAKAQRLIMRYPTVFEKSTFASDNLMYWVSDGSDAFYDYIEFVGVCTDICVISNALVCKMARPDCRFGVDAFCCAGSTPEKHKMALEVMKSCHIDILNEEKSK